MEGRSAGRTLMGEEMDGVPCRQCWQPSPFCRPPGAAECNPNPVSVAHILPLPLRPICPSAAIRNAAVSGSPHSIHATNVLGKPPRSRVGNTIDSGNISFSKYYGRGLIRPEKEIVNGRGERCQPALLHVNHTWSGLKGEEQFSTEKKESLKKPCMKRNRKTESSVSQKTIPLNDS